MQRLVLLGGPAGLLAGVVFYFWIGWPYLAQNQPRPTPPQPIAFEHNVHVQVAGLDCGFCHRTAESAPTAGYPDVEQCMFCHITIGRGIPEIEKVRTHWVEQRPINWTRVHRMPDHTHFPHDRHVQAGFDCATCHGDVGQMKLANQVRPLTMGDCMDCHRQHAAPIQCGVCHY